MKHALLWGGPQEGFDNPNIDVELYVNSKAMRAGGMMIAGVPIALALFGTNWRPGRLYYAPARRRMRMIHQHQEQIAANN